MSEKCLWRGSRKTAMKKLGFDDKTVKVVADATVNTPVWLETDRGVWSDETDPTGIL